MLPRDYFPLGKAQGEAFCNRKAETKWLVNNIQAGKHSLLIAPRRFGKSSLAEQAVIISGLPMVMLNFNTCTDERDVETLVRQGVSNLIGNALGPVEKLINSIKNYASHLTPKITFETKHAHLELTSKRQISSATNVEEALTLLEKLLAEKKQHAVMLYDEFQTVGLIAKGSGVEAALRNVAQNMKHISIIFSGSNSTLLKTMFEDERRPLYKLCRKLHLKRIKKSHYKNHLNQAAQLAWGVDLDNQVFEQIMALSETHPYYVNYLCDVLWTECTQPPQTDDVERAWQAVIEEESSDANAEIANLSMGQKKVIKYMANYSSTHLLSAEAVKITGMALSSISGAIVGLIEKDVIEKQDNHYEIINPIVKHLLKVTISTA